MPTVATVGIGLGCYGKCKKERNIMTTVGIGLGCYGKCKKERNIMTTIVVMILRSFLN
jgi:hypothetical protein